MTRPVSHVPPRVLRVHTHRTRPSHCPFVPLVIRGTLCQHPVYVPPAQAHARPVRGRLPPGTLNVISASATPGLFKIRPPADTSVNHARLAAEAVRWALHQQLRVMRMDAVLGTTTIAPPNSVPPALQTAICVEAQPAATHSNAQRATVSTCCPVI